MAYPSMGLIIDPDETFEVRTQTTAGGTRIVAVEIRLASGWFTIQGDPEPLLAFFAKAHHDLAVAIANAWPKDATSRCLTDVEHATLAPNKTAAVAHYTQLAEDAARV
ncbi:MAG TPA: hypothetical protein VM345_01815 [Acidimicrobiales bacterium]|nr:hypothetical protein [Acidimicrobiales bacterium]